MIHSALAKATNTPSRYSPSSGGERRRIGGRNRIGKRGNPAQVLQQHHRADHRRHHRGEEIRRRAAQIHPRDDHVEEEIERGRGCGAGRRNTTESVSATRSKATWRKIWRSTFPSPGRVLLAEAEEQVIAQHGAGDDIQRRRPGDDPQQRAGQPDHGEDRRAGQPAQRDQPAAPSGGASWRRGRDRGPGLGVFTMFWPRGRLLAGGFARCDRQTVCKL